MRRLRFFRVLVPAALVLFLVLVVLAVRDRPAVHNPPDNATSSIRSAQGIEYTEYDGTDRVLAGKFGVLEMTEEGRYRLEGIRQLEVERKDDSPLVVDADLGQIVGSPGKRIMRFDTEVVVADPDDDFTLRMASLQVDEAANQARSPGELRFSGPTYEGRARNLLYDLTGGPTRMSSPEMHGTDGSVMTARGAVLHDGFRDIELEDDVDVRRDDEYLRAERVRIWRDEGGAMQRAVAQHAVNIAVRSDASGLIHADTDRLEANWDAEGLLRDLTLEGGAELRHGGESLAADTILAVAGVEQEGWQIEASGAVYLQGNAGDGPGWLRSDRLFAELAPGMELRSARAVGRVLYHGPETRAEATRAEFSVEDGVDEIVLFASSSRKARLASGRTRIAALRVTTDGRATRMLAEDQVEATLLAVEADESDPGFAALGLFRADDVIHFVSDRLEALQSGSQLLFQGRVRGWQGERNLSADRMDVDQPSRTLAASGNVTTRIPRQTGGLAISTQDFVQITADRLDYREETRRAVYRDHVRVQLEEGWIEAQRLEVDLEATTSRVKEIRAYSGVLLEFNDRDAEDGPQVIAGRSDRLVYRPTDKFVWLIGDEAPAAVRRVGGDGGVTRGRVVRYRLDDGSLEVDSGGQVPASVTTET